MKQTTINFEASRPRVSGMDRSYALKYLAKAGENFYLVDCPKNIDIQDYYKSHRLFVGSCDKLRQAEVSSFNRSRDGATEITFGLEGQIGELHFPPFLDDKLLRKEGRVIYGGVKPIEIPLEIFYDPLGEIE